MHVIHREGFEHMCIGETSRSNGVNIFRVVEGENLLEVYLLDAIGKLINLNEKSTHLPQEEVSRSRWNIYMNTP